MNKTSIYCHSNQIHTSYLSNSQLAVLTVTNLTVTVGNVAADAMVIYALIKTKQLYNVANKLIFMLSISNLLIGGFAQNFYIAVIYGTNCLAELIARAFSVFLINLSSYTIAIMGIDRFIRIKYYASFKVILTTRFILTLVSIACLAALVNAVGLTIGFLLKLDQIFTRVNFFISAIILSTVTFLQVLVIRTSNTVHMESKIDLAHAANKIITKLSMRIMLLVLFCHAPLLIVHLISSKFQAQINKKGKSILEFIACLSIIIIYANSLINAILFLTMNVKAKRFLRDFVRQ